MSLLVFNASNRIAQGVVRKLYGSGNFEKIVCADVYPSYSSIQRFLNFKNELGAGNSNTQLTDVKITERSDLKEAIANASHVVYITHDYYSLTASKLNLIKTTAELAKKSKVQSLVALTPVEHDHYGEESPVEVAKSSESEALKNFPEMVHLKADLTFGPDSTFAHSILTRAINSLGLAYSAPVQGPVAHPIHTDDVAAIVENALKDGSHQGKSYVLQGPDGVTLADYIKTLAAHAGETGLSTRLVERIISPSIANPISERLYDPNYMNLVRLLAKYQAPNAHGLESARSFNVPLQHFKNSYPERGVNRDSFTVDESSLERLVKGWLY